VDGKLVAMDEEGRSNFTLLQNFKSAESKIHNFPFDMKYPSSIVNAHNWLAGAA